MLHKRKIKHIFFRFSGAIPGKAEATRAIEDPQWTAQNVSLKGTLYLKFDYIQLDVLEILESNHN